MTDAVLQADARGDPVGPAAVSLLLRRYVSSGREDLRGAIERGLTAALAEVQAYVAGLKGPRHATLAARPFHGGFAEHLTVLAEAAAVADDDRIGPALAAGAEALQRNWPNRADLLDAMAQIGACVMAAAALPADVGGPLLRPAIDELERVLGRVYRPGEPLARSLAHPDEADGGVAEHVGAAATLLTAHSVTARLPYSMLAEELMQTFDWSTGDFRTRVQTARVLCRVAALHDDPEYRRAAVMKPHDYCEAARQIVDSLAAEGLARGAAAAPYGLAIDELLAIGRDADREPPRGDGSS